jgi:hypothetical protein
MNLEIGRFKFYDRTESYNHWSFNGNSFVVFSKEFATATPYAFSQIAPIIHKWNTELVSSDQSSEAKKAVEAFLDLPEGEEFVAYNEKPYLNYVGVTYNSAFE